ncbi:unnamed protein product [Calypogeia fissa]
MIISSMEKLINPVTRKNFRPLQITSFIIVARANHGMAWPRPPVGDSKLPNLTTAKQTARARRACSVTLGLRISSTFMSTGVVL